MSSYDHKVMQDLRLGQWGDPPAPRSWETEREAARLRDGQTARRERAQRGSIEWLLSYTGASVSKSAAK